MKKNAFTLIELLAVIVILAIVALIATPIILGIIKDAKEEAKKISAENYLGAVEQAIVRENMKGIFRPTECDIIDGNVICDGKELKVEVDGEVPKNGTIYFSNGSVSTGTLLNYDGYIKKINNLDKENVKAVITPTTGIIPVVENEQIKPGSEFQIRVNDTSGWLTFFVLSNDGDYVNLIAEQNITIDGKFTREPQNGDEWYVTESNQARNTYGPQTSYTYLSKATRNWTNIPVIENFDYEDETNQSNSGYGYQSLKTKFDETTGKYITKIIPNSKFSSVPATYKNMRIRLPYKSEITENTTCSTTTGFCPLWMVNYLYSSDNYKSEEKVNSIGENYGYWLLSSYSVDSFVCDVRCVGKVLETTSNDSFIGIRPVITILKSDLIRVMK